MPISPSDHRRMWAPLKAMKALFASKEAREQQAKDLAANVAVARAKRVMAAMPQPKAEPEAMLNDYSFNRANKYSAQHVAELHKMQNQAADELEKLNARAEGAGLTEVEEDRMEEVLAAHDAIDGELKRMAKSRSATTRAASVSASIRDDQRRNRYSGLVSADEESEDDEEEDDDTDEEDEDVKPTSKGKSTAGRARSTVTYRDQNDRKVRSLSMDEPFGGRRARSSGERRQPMLGERIAAHLGIKSLSGINNTIWEGTDGGGGFLTGSQTLAGIINPARPQTVIFPGGAQLLEMTESETVLIEQLTDATAHWTPELGEVEGSGMTFGRIVLKPRKLAVIVPLSIEIMEDAPNAPDMIQQAIVQSTAIDIDRAALSGTGAAEQPLGIRNRQNVNTHTIVGAPANDYSDLETAIEKIRLANYVGEDSGLSWIRHPRDASQYNRLQDTLLQPLQPTPGAASLRKLQTTTMPINLGGGAASEMVVGDLSQVVVGVRTGASIRILPAGTVNVNGQPLNAASQFACFVAFHMRVDIAVIRPQWLTVIDGVTW